MGEAATVTEAEAVAVEGETSTVRVTASETVRATVRATVWATARAMVWAMARVTARVTIRMQAKGLDSVRPLEPDP